MADDEALLRGLRSSGLTAPPPGFANAPQHQQAATQPPQQQQGLELDEVHLTSIFRLALDDDGVFRPQVAQQMMPQQPPQGYYPPPHMQPPQHMMQMHPPQQQPRPMGMPQFGGSPAPQGYNLGPPQFRSMPPQFMQQQQPGSPMMPQMPHGVSPMMPQMPHGGSPMMQGGFRPPAGMMPPGPGNMPFAPLPPPAFGHSTPPAETRDMRFKDYERMKGREIGFIVRSQLRTVETGDDFADDYYFLQAEEKKRNLASQSAANAAAHYRGLGNVEDVSNADRPAELLKVLKAIQGRSSETEPSTMPVIRPPVGPLPELSATKTAQQEALDRKSKQITNAANKWAGAKNVLGRSTKGNLRTPRELIALHNAILSDDQSNGDKNECYASAGWKLRKVTLDVADALGEVTDLSRHLKARAAAVPAGLVGSGWEFFHEKLKELERQQREACDHLAKSMGLTDGDDALLLSLLWLPKGRRTAVKAMKSLLPEHLLLFLEAAARMLVYFTCTSPDGKNSIIATEKEKFELDMLAANALAKEFTQVDLAEATKCLRLFLESQTPESLRAVIATPGGAAVTKSLLIHGQEESENITDEELKNKWNDAFGAFIAMAEEGISAKEAGSS